MIGGPTTASLLNTSTNTIVAQFFSSTPGNGEPVTDNNFAAFGPDGNSVWMVLACGGVPYCTTVDGAATEVVGLSVPSGKLIAQFAVPSDSLNIAFPTAS